MCWQLKNKEYRVQSYRGKKKKKKKKSKTALCTWFTNRQNWNETFTVSLQSHYSLTRSSVMLHTLSLRFAILVKTSPLTFLHKSLQAMVNFSVVVPEQLWYGFLHSEARVNAFFSGTDRNQYYSSPYAVLPHGSFTKPTVHDVNTKHNFLRVFRWCRDISRGSRGDHVYFFS